jgi:hypothetical protein
VKEDLILPVSHRELDESRFANGVLPEEERRFVSLIDPLSHFEVSTLDHSLHDQGSLILVEDGVAVWDHHELRDERFRGNRQISQFKDIMISDQTSPVQVNQFGRFNCHFRALGKGIRKISFNSLMKKKDWCLFNKMAKKHKKNLGRRAQNIEAITRDDVDGVDFNVQYFEYEVLQMYWKLIIKHRAVRILHKYCSTDLVVKNIDKARKESNWNEIKVYLDSFVEHQGRATKANEYHFWERLIEYRYLLTKGCDLLGRTQSNPFLQKKEFYFWLTIGMEFSSPGQKLIDDVDPQVVYNLSLIIVPILHLLHTDRDQCHQACLYENVCNDWVTPLLSMVNWTSLHFPVIHRMFLNNDPRMDWDELFFTALRADNQQLREFLTKIKFRPSDRVIAGIDQILGN